MGPQSGPGGQGSCGQCTPTPKLLARQLWAPGANRPGSPGASPAPLPDVRFCPGLWTLTGSEEAEALHQDSAPHPVGWGVVWAGFLEGVAPQAGLEE